MEELFEVFPIKRGRPKKTDSCKQKQSLNALDHDAAKRLKHLTDLQNAYIKYQYTPRLQNFIWNFLSSLGLPEEVLIANLIEILQENVKFFMITELEFVALCQLLELIDMHSMNMDIEEMIKICCLVVMRRMESDSNLVDLLKMKVKVIYKKFEESFQVFENCLDFDIRDLNKKYNDLQNSKSRKVIYTYYVDQILRNSPPYCSKKLLKQKSGDYQSNIKLSDKVITQVTTQQKNIEFTHLKPIRLQDKHLQNSNLDDRPKNLDFLNDSDFCSGYYAKSDFDNLI